MPKKKTSADKPRSESAPTSPQNDETVVEFVFGLETDPQTRTPHEENAPAPDATRKKAKKRSVFFKFTNNPG